MAANSLSDQKMINLLAVKLVVFYLFIAGALFIPAGRVDWVAGWVYVGLHALFAGGLTLWLARNDPGLLAERATAEQKKIPKVDRAILLVVRVLTVCLYVVAGLDAGRYNWSTVAVSARALGWVLGLAAGVMVAWVMRTNTFASAVVRLQAERGHHVIEDGPYRFVRHPMYLGNLCLFLGLPLILGSWWAYIPAVLLALAFLLRTAQEDRYLLTNLAGYADFSRRTRSRLFPGVW